LILLYAPDLEMFFFRTLNGGKGAVLRVYLTIAQRFFEIHAIK
jgi:hypothetical protein